jgi:hypothetical protein
VPRRSRAPNAEQDDAHGDGAAQKETLALADGQPCAGPRVRASVRAAAWPRTGRGDVRETDGRESEQRGAHADEEQPGSNDARSAAMCRLVTNEPAETHQMYTSEIGSHLRQQSALSPLTNRDTRRPSVTHPMDLSTGVAHTSAEAAA